MKDKKIVIIEGCIICRTCEFTDPSSFIVKESTLSAEVINENITEDRLPVIKEAIRLCPVNVIKLKDKNDKK
jgi:ferredoxin